MAKLFNSKNHMVAVPLKVAEGQPANKAHIGARAFGEIDDSLLDLDNLPAGVSDQTERAEPKAKK